MPEVAQAVAESHSVWPLCKTLFQLGKRSWCRRGRGSPGTQGGTGPFPGPHPCSPIIPGLPQRALIHPTLESTPPKRTMAVPWQSHQAGGADILNRAADGASYSPISPETWVCALCPDHNLRLQGMRPFYRLNLPGKCRLPTSRLGAGLESGPVSLPIPTEPPGALGTSRSLGSESHRNPFAAPGWIVS